MIKVMLLAWVPLCAFAADVSGQWNLHLIRFGEEFGQARVELKAAGNKLTGTLNDLTINTDVRLPDGGRFVAKGAVDIAGRDKAYDITSALHTVNLNTVLAKAHRQYARLQREFEWLPHTEVGCQGQRRDNFGQADT